MGSYASPVRRRFLNLVSSLRSGQSKLLGPDQAASLVWPPGDAGGAILTDSEEFRTTVTEPYETMWTEAEGFSFRTPGHSRLLETLEEWFDADLRVDVERTVTAAGVHQAQAAGLDEVHVQLIVATTHSRELYELSRGVNGSG